MDLPSSVLFQQLNAKEVSGEHLEVLGKKAAALWCEGRCKTLNEAVVETVKHAGLSPEQVKRVVEFTNTSAYLNEFQKEGFGHKIVDFGEGGPASYAAVLQDLNDGGGGSVFDPGTGDYDQPPREKTSMVSDNRLEQAFANMFHARDIPLADHNPLRNVIELRDKLASSYERATSQLSTLENMYGDILDRVYSNVKQASLGGHSLSEIVEIWSRYAPDDEYVKVAFRTILPRLIDNGVFPNGAAAAASLQKVAHVGVVNEDHPLVADFKDFCEILTKLAETRVVQESVGDGLAEVTNILKQANEEQGFVQKGVGLLQRAANVAGQHGTRAGEVLFGPGKGKLIGTLAKGLTYAAPVIGVNEVYRRTLKHNPTFQEAKSTVLGAIPGTQEYHNKEYELELRGHGMDGMMGY